MFIVSPEYTVPQTEVLPELTDDTASTPSPLLVSSKIKKDRVSLRPQLPPTASSSIPSPATEASCNLHKIKWQMQNFIVPTDWYPTGTQTVCLNHENIDSM